MATSSFLCSGSSRKRPLGKRNGPGRGKKMTMAKAEEAKKSKKPKILQRFLEFYANDK